MELLQSAGILVSFISPYSSDLNPIELTFNYLKQYLQEHEEVIQAANNVTNIVKSGFESITVENCKKMERMWLLTITT